MQPMHKKYPSDRRQLAPERARALRRVEALRLGVVPDVRDGSNSVGRARQMSAVESTLSATGRGQGGLQAFIGDYGAGKTHLLEEIRAEALRRGFATAHVVLDPQECKPSHPRRVHRRITTGLAYPDTRHGGLRPLLARALRSDRARDVFMVDSEVEPRDALEDGAHLYLTPALRYLDELGVLESGTLARPKQHAVDLLMRWLEGDPTLSNSKIQRAMQRVAPPRGKLFSLKDYRPWSRIYAYLLSGLARLARLSGYGGVAVVLDEAEFHAVLSTRNRGFALELFRSLAWAAKSGRDLPFPRSALDGGGQGVLKRLPPNYDEASNLYVAMAFTPTEDGRDTVEDFIPRGWIRRVNGLQARQLGALVEPLVQDFLTAHPGVDIRSEHTAALEAQVESLAESGELRTPRDATRFVVSMLDLGRHGDLADELERLTNRNSTQAWGW